MIYIQGKKISRTFSPRLQKEISMLGSSSRFRKIFQIFPYPLLLLQSKYDNKGFNYKVSLFVE